MKFSHYVKRVEESKSFKELRKKHPNSFLCAGFFVIDLEQGKHVHQVDYMLSNGKIATFNMDNGVEMKISEIPFQAKSKLKRIEKESRLDIDALKGIVQDEMKNRTITEDVKKIIAVLQVMDGRLVWNINCIAGGMNIVQVHVDDVDGSVLKFEKHSIMEFVRKM